MVLTLDSIAQFFRVITGVAARQRREAEEDYLAKVELERLRIAEQKHKAEVEKHREIMKRVSETKRRNIALAYRDALEKILRGIYQIRYNIITAEMLHVTLAAYETFRIKVICEAGPLRGHEIVDMFAEAFRYTEIAGDWRSGTLNVAGKEGVALPALFKKILPYVQPDPVWLLEGKDPTKYWRGDNVTMDILQDFFEEHPKWYEEGISPPFVDSKGDRLVERLRQVERRYTDKLEMVGRSLGY